MNTCRFCFSTLKFSFFRFCVAKSPECVSASSCFTVYFFLAMIGFMLTGTVGEGERVKERGRKGEREYREIVYN